MRAILGQEALVPKYGIGRVKEIGRELLGRPQFIKVETYADGIARDYNADNVLLIMPGKMDVVTG